eukprot:6791397-Lingulodinium_polyedra.AAC.1
MAANLSYASPWLMVGRGGGGRGRCIVLEIAVVAAPRRTVDALWRWWKVVRAGVSSTGCAWS